MRETREELEMDIELGDLVGVYSRADTRAVLVVFDARARVGHETAEASQCARLRPASCRGTRWRSGRPSRRCATRSGKPRAGYARAARERERELFAVTVVIGSPSVVSLLGRLMCSHFDTRAGSVEMMISS